MTTLWKRWTDSGTGSPLNSLCSPDLTAADFFFNDLGRWTPCFIDLAVLGLAHLVALLVICIHIVRAHSRTSTRYSVKGVAASIQVFQEVVAAACALVPVLELNGKLGQAAGSSDAGPAPHEYAAAALATCSWALLALLYGVELRGYYVPVGRWTVRFVVVLATSSELVKLRIIVAAQPIAEYFLYLYIAYVSMQCFLSILALLWWPNASHLAMEQEGYVAIPEGSRWTPEAHEGHPESKAGVIGTLTFSWLSQLMSAGYKASLTKDQVPPLPKADRVDAVALDFEKHWRAELEGQGPPSLTNACWKTVRHLFILALPCKLLIDASQFVGPVFLNRLLMVVEDRSAPAWEGYIYAGVMFIGIQIGSLADHQHFQLVMRGGSRLGAVLGAKVAAQVLRLAPSARAQFSTGRIYSAIASDAEQLSQLCANIFALMSAPLRIAGAMYLLYLQLGLASIATLACLLVLIPVNIVLVRWSGTLLKSALVHTDERTKLEGELVGGMEVVKCSAWEKPFLERIMQARGKELSTLWRMSAVTAVQGFVIFSVPTIVPVGTFSTYLLLGNTLTSAKAFTALALFNVLRLPVFQLPMMLQIITQARVSVARLQDILVAETLEDQPPQPAAKPGEPAVVLRGDFSWDKEGKGVPALADVNLSIPAGQLVAVVGSTGSGKSTLLSAMLRQMQQVYGDAPVLKGKVAYVPQAAFIINATVRDNILFGKPYDAAHYERCIHASCLDTDLGLLAGGDAAELGDKGVNLSGGQRQRVSIARALYSDADVILLDDPLSALDSKVGRRVFEQAIRSQLLQRGKTVILATNQLQFVQAADQVVFMSSGKVAERGSFPQLMAAAGPFATMMKEVQVDDEEPEGAAAAAASGTPAQPATTGAVQSNKSAPGAQLASEEKTSEGSVSSEVLFGYVGFMGGILSFLYLMLGFIVVEVLRVMTNVWLSFWTGSTDSQEGDKDPMYYLGVFTAISGVQLVAQFVNMLDMPRFCLKAAGALHERLLHNLLAAPMSFFHTTPLGRIVNRLTKDTADVDRQLAGNAGMAVRNMLQVVSCIALVGWVAPLALPSFVAITLVFWLLYQYYQASLRQVKRLEAVTRSPVFTSVSEIITGCATIQAFGSGPRLVQRHNQLIDSNMANTFISNSLSRWLAVRLEALGNLCTLMAAVVAVEQRGGASSAGLVLSYAMQMTILMSLMLRSTSVVENNFNSVERVIEYTALPMEGSGPDEQRQGRRGVNPQQPKDSAPAVWPNQGDVEFKQVAMRYRPGLPLVLRGVSFKARANEKVGIVGRTGAGKSSMIGCLFRLTEVEGGSIEIDGINIAKVPLHRLRSSMALIPQVPVLFTGTIRLNLSPFGLHSDAELWSVLRRAHLAAVIEAWPAGLDTLLQEGGAPLSAGQKQLLALARAQLNPAKVLVLDEATANVDVETDALIQRTMRTEFKDRTMLAVAHRLHTIIDVDKVLVLDKGLVAEFSSPKELLSNPSGIFTSMVEDTGEATAKFLKAVANGKVDLEASIKEAAEDGMEKLCTPAAQGDDALLGSGLPSGVVLQSLAAQLLERSKAVVKKVKDVSSNLAKHAEEDADALATEGLLQSMSSTGSMGHAHGFSSAQRSLLQALELLAQVERYARAAEVAAQAHNPDADVPSNLADLRQALSARGEGAAGRGTHCTARADADSAIRSVLSELVQHPISMPVRGGDAAAASSSATASDGMAATASSAEVSTATRRASDLLRATSIRETKYKAPDQH